MGRCLRIAAGRAAHGDRGVLHRIARRRRYRARGDGRAAPPVPPRHRTGHDPGVPRLLKMRILVIEDDLKVAHFISSGLAQQAYAVDVLHQGTDPATQALAYAYDAVVLDLMLPGRSGFQVLRAIAAR